MDTYQGFCVFLFIFLIRFDKNHEKSIRISSRFNDKKDAI